MATKTDKIHITSNGPEKMAAFAWISGVWPVAENEIRAIWSNVNQIALCHLDSEENVVKMLPVNQQTGTFSGRDLEKLSFGIIPTRCRDLHLKQFCLDGIVPAVLIILITHIIISVRWILIKNLSVVINHYLHGM